MKKTSLAYLLCALPFVSYAQCGLDCDPSSSASVIGGGEKARECFVNARTVSANPELANSRMLEPCTYFITYIDSAEKNIRAATYTNRGVIRVALNNYAAAFSDFNIAMNLLPDTPQIYVNRGNAFYQSGNYPMALEDYSRALELGIAEAHVVHLNLGKTYERLGNRNLAEQSYRQAVDLMPTNVEAQLLLSGLLSQPDS
tara:strand:+ start:556 stop:1155 length:600 start_codon:yes stop_codon:yes gene_type:complete